MLGKRAALIVMFLISTTGFAGPPFFTDDPEPVERNHSEFYLASQLVSDNAGQTGTLPQAEFNYGIGRELQFHVVTPYGFSRDRGTDQVDRGYGDTEVGLKYRVKRESALSPQIGVFPLVELPTGDSKRGLGNGKAQIFVPIWLQKSWGPWTTYGGGGYWLNPGREIATGRCQVGFFSAICRTN
ncbi:MAG: hypothetical protein HQM09_20170 [Candidatus Riflebacteria bacterium]|nr:hypothetical protein [Candidatus Riflebacteria bacterium]